MTVVGELALWVALFLAVWASAASFGGATLGRPELVASGVRSVVASGSMVALACLGVWSALLGHAFSFEYVASRTTLNTPTLYLITAFWAGAPGALLSFGLALVAFTVIAVSALRRPELGVLPWATGALATLLAITLATVCFVTNPYDRLEWVPAEGQGLPPRLQTPIAIPYYVAIHGAYGAAAVAVALAIAGAVCRRPGHGRFAAVRTWSIACWFLLTLGLALHMRWTYLHPASAGLWRLDLVQVTHVVAWIGTFVLVWSPATGEDVSRRQPAAVARRRIGALAVSVGVALLIAGVGAQRLWRDEVVTLRPGQAIERADPFSDRWRFISQGISRDERANYLSTGVALEARHNGRTAGIISGERRQYLDSFQRPTLEPAMVPGILSSLRLDVYLVLSEVRGEAAQVRIGFRPLVSCVWIGWVLIAAGGLAIAAVRPRGLGGRHDSAAITA